MHPYTGLGSIKQNLINYSFLQFFSSITITLLNFFKLITITPFQLHLYLCVADFVYE